jgi:GNAT superfamily N-acetyltransferase
MTAAARDGSVADPGPSAGPLPITIVPASPDRWPDVAEIVGSPSGWGCWCQYYRWSAGDFNRLGRDGGPAALRSQLADDPPPGLLAYVEGQPVGWCGIGVRSRMERLVRSRTIPRVDDAPVWSVVCFLIRPGMRRRGIAKALLDGAVRYARAAGAVGLEGYPVDPAGARLQTAGLYVGTTSMFEAAGFRRVLMTASRSDHRPRWLMRLDLVPDPAPDAA